MGRAVLSLLVAVAAFALAGASRVAAQPVDSAYYEFLLGRHLESQGDLDEALAAFQRAEGLDPESAEIPADIANIYVRLNRPAEAVSAAERALQRDPDNITANRILGTIFASISEAPRIGAEEARRNAGRAAEYLEKADPENGAGVMLLLGRMYVRAERWDDAIRALSDVVAERPTSRDAVGLLVQAYQGAGRGEEALVLLEAASPASARLSMMLAEMYEDQGRWADAAEAYARASETRPMDLDLKVRWASALVNAGRTPLLEQARDVLGGVLETDPSHTRGLYLLVQVERSLLELDGAEATARRLMETNPSGVWGPYALALVLGDRQDHRGVIDVLEPLARGWDARTDQGEGLNPALLYRLLGAAYLGLDQPSRAVEQLERAQAYAPGDVGLARLLAGAHLASGNLDRGVAVIDALIERSGGRPMAYEALAELYVDAGRVNDAMAVLDRAAAGRPDDPSVFFGVGAALERADFVAEAEQAFRRVLEIDQNHVQALNYLGYMLASRDQRLEESAGYIRRALELEPDNPAIIDSLGWVYFKLDRLDLAERYLSEAAANLATNSVIQDHLGDALFRLGRVDEATAAWQRALAGDGDSIDRSVIEQKIQTVGNGSPDN